MDTDMELRAAAKLYADESRAWLDEMPGGNDTLQYRCFLASLKRLRAAAIAYAKNPVTEE